MGGPVETKETVESKEEKPKKKKGKKKKKKKKKKDSGSGDSGDSSSSDDDDDEEEESEHESEHEHETNIIVINTTCDDHHDENEDTVDNDVALEIISTENELHIHSADVETTHVIEQTDEDCHTDNVEVIVETETVTVDGDTGEILNVESTTEVVTMDQHEAEAEIETTITVDEGGCEVDTDANAEVVLE